MVDNNKRIQITYKDVEGEEEKQLEFAYGPHLKFVTALPTVIKFPKKFVEVADSIENFKIRPDDVWFLAYPRTGSNWVQEMAWLIGHDLNYEEANKTLLPFRSPLLEGTALVGHLYGEWGKKPENMLEYATNEKSPRHIKTHLPWNFAPLELVTVKPKIICTIRNPKDVCVSLHKLLTLTMDLKIPFEIFCELFLQGRVVCGSYFEHLLTYWNMRHQLNIIFLKYEEMKKDVEATIARIAEFLEKKITEDEIKQLAEHVSFEKMSKNPSVNRQDVLKALKEEQQREDLPMEFIRKGEVGDWRNHMSPEIAAKFDEMTVHYFKDTGISFE
ncbi:Sulfotransferase 1C2 [Blattella germanica]|nr:Sulfotransferase 1C2 [Blattella germanica]